MKPVWIVLLCLLGAAVLAALVWLLVWYIEQRVLAKSLGRASEGADAQAAWEQHILRKQDWTADSEPGRAALARVRAGVAAMQEQPHEDVFLPAWYQVLDREDRVLYTGSLPETWTHASFD